MARVPGLRGLAAAALVLLAGCVNAENEGAGVAARGVGDPAFTAGSGGIDPGTYAGEVAFRIDTQAELRGQTLPYTIFLGLSERTATRMEVNTFLDLRALQAAAPEILSGVLDETCGRRIELRLDRMTGVGEELRLDGQVLAEFFTCRREGRPDEARGMRLLSQKVDAAATATARPEGVCITLEITDLTLEPLGFIGGVADFFGLTEQARIAILERGGAYLDDNPICPNITKELAALYPRLETAGPREIPVGGAGAALSGTLDVNSTTLIGLLQLLQDRGLLELDE